MDYGAAGITVNAYAPGFVDTPMRKSRSRESPGTNTGIVRDVKEQKFNLTGVTGEEYERRVMGAYTFVVKLNPYHSRYHYSPYPHYHSSQISFFEKTVHPAHYQIQLPLFLPLVGASL